MGQWVQNKGDRGAPHLLLQLGGLEGEQELLDVVLAELVDAAGIDGPAQELVHLVLGVEGLLGTTAGEWGGSGPSQAPSSASGRGWSRPPQQPSMGTLTCPCWSHQCPGRHKGDGGVSDTGTDGGDPHG